MPRKQKEQSLDPQHPGNARQEWQPACIPETETGIPGKINRIGKQLVQVTDSASTSIYMVEDD